MPNYKIDPINYNKLIEAEIKYQTENTYDFNIEFLEIAYINIYNYLFVTKIH